jgi:hypothetical protein
MNTKNSITRTVVIFVALAVAGLAVALSARFVMSALEQSIIVGVGSALFGASLTFFLIRILSITEK